MIGLILGTSEGKSLLSRLNKFTNDIFVSTATSYGGELLKDYKYKVLNTKPLTKEEIIKVILTHKLKFILDATHPYALEVTKNVMSACEKCNIEHIRYERPSVLYKYANSNLVTKVEDYAKLHKELKNIKGNILNTTGSKNIDKILNLGIQNRIIHKVLPRASVLEKCSLCGVNLEDIIAIKGAGSFDLNQSLYKEYNIKGLILKDSGKKGGTEEKIDAALSLGINVFVIERKKVVCKTVLSSEDDVISYLIQKGYIEKSEGEKGKDAC